MKDMAADIYMQVAPLRTMRTTLYLQLSFALLSLACSTDYQWASASKQHYLEDLVSPER